MKWIPLYAMPRGSILYHGTANTGFDVPRGPAWVTDDRGTARELTNWRPDQRGKTPRILKLKTNRVLRLLDITRPRDFTTAVERYLGTTDAAPEDVRSYDLAAALCDEGKRDGWICDAGCLWKDARGSDILICEPSSALERVRA